MNLLRNFLLAVCFFSPELHAQELRLPSSATLTSEDFHPDSVHEVPVGAWAKGILPTQTFTGSVTRRSWRIDTAGISTQQLLRNMREQITNARFDIKFECETSACGGYDFRFALDLTRPPKMQVNLADFGFLSATRADLAIYAIASRTRNSSFLQITHVGEQRGTVQLLQTPSIAPAINGPLPHQLDSIGKAVLEGLSFERGSSRLSEGPFEALEDLASYLAQNPNINVTLVGHTDTEGPLEGNIALSKRRAASVLERLVTDHSVSRQRLAAEGMGYLSPLASNLTPAGRETNRRVEVIVMNLEN